MVKQIKSAMVQNGMQIEIKANNLLSKPWFDHECYIAKKIMKATLTKYIRSNRDVDRLEYVETRNKYTSIINNKKKKYFCEIQEKLNNTYDSSEFWKTIARFRKRNYTQGNISISDWQQFYNKLLDTEPIPDYEPVTMTFLNTDNELTKCITLNEISKEISRISHGKATGFDDIMNEAIKALPKDYLTSLKDIFNRILRTSEFPTTWLKSVIQPIFKNGDPDDPSNYRGIALLSNISKLFTSILKSRLGSWIERRNIVPENQAGFRAGHSCQDHIFTLSSLIQMTLSRKRRKCYMFFVDLKKAFDTVPHSLLWRKLVDAGLNHRFVNLIKYYYTNMTAVVRWNNSFTAPIKVASHYKGKALAAIGAVWQVLTKSKMNSLNAAMRLLDSTVLPHMLYTAPCWALNQVKVVDQVQNIFLRRYLNLPKYTPGFMLRMECGRVSQEVIITKQVLRFWSLMKDRQRVSSDTTHFAIHEQSSACSPEAINGFLQGATESITLEDSDPLNREDISLSEVETAINRLPQGKAAGWDSVPCELVKGFEDFSVGAIHRVILESKLRQVLPESSRRNIICLVPKAHGGPGLSGYRPISLPTADYRIVSGILLGRLRRHSPAMVPECQTYAVPGRCPSWNIACVSDEVVLAFKNKSPLTVISTDLQSAFDNVDREFLAAQLRSIGLPQPFLEWLPLLYAQADATIKVNGNFPRPLKMRKGLRQGCTCSAALFSIFTVLHHLHGYLPCDATIAKLQARLTRLVWGSCYRAAWLPGTVMTRPVSVGGVGLLDIKTQLQLACFKGVQTEHRVGGRNDYSWLVESGVWMAPMSSGAWLAQRRPRLLELWEQASSILGLNHSMVPIPTLLNLPLVGTCRFLATPSLRAPSRWSGVRVRDLASPAPSLTTRVTRNTCDDAAALVPFCRGLVVENVESSHQEKSLEEAVVLRGTATPFLRISTRNARRMLEHPHLAAVPISRYLRRWAPVVDVPSTTLAFSSLRRCSFGSHAADITLRLALHALPHPGHPASSQPVCIACGSSDLSLAHRYWSCSAIRFLIREVFSIIGRPPDLQFWIFAVGLEDHAITISSAAKRAIYVFFIDREMRGIAGDPLVIFHQALQRMWDVMLAAGLLVSALTGVESGVLRLGESFPSIFKQDPDGLKGAQDDDRIYQNIKIKPIITNNKIQAIQNINTNVNANELPDAEDEDILSMPQEEEEEENEDYDYINKEEDTDEDVAVSSEE
ncbi:hypothetical protein LAZ67_2005844 [Cordylochernes scorpioides]|uniref:Reverse transcriptase domain-containing protein n=1 Tax=Cordylochernes scorpioides TaxID=51811 RepID=A0ABY6K4S8_9ARAC|nr:hypothetical protein LAZ67_2005844 [Cordylochernes scorpioides]